jgi:hypothetical protein
VTQPLFTLTGRLRPGRQPGGQPAQINRATYSRDAVNGVRVDVIANACGHRHGHAQTHRRRRADGRC